MIPENRYMRPESTETHFGYLVHFSGFHFFVSSADEIKLADKAQLFLWALGFSLLIFY